MNESIAAALAKDDRSPKVIAAEIGNLKVKAQNLVRFLAGGGSDAVRDELRSIEEKIAAKRAEHEAAVERPRAGSVKIRRERVVARLEKLAELLRKDSVRAKAKIARHLNGQLKIRALPSKKNERSYEISGTVRRGGLLWEEETAGRLQFIAGVGFEPTTSRL